MVTPSGVLDIIILVYYVPALLIAIYVGFKHGFGKSLGWYNLNLLSLFRILGSALGLAAIYQPSTSIIAASVTFSSMGTVSLVGALLGLATRVNESLRDHAIPARIRKLLQMIIIAAIVLAIVGGTRVSSSDPDTRSEGHNLTQAAICLILAAYIIAAGICAINLKNNHLVPDGERRLLYVSVASLPFILVRLVFSLCSVFRYTDSAFSSVSTTTTAIVIRAIMGILMEFIVVGMFLWAGCTVNRSAQREAERAEKYNSHGVYKGKDGYVQHDHASGPQPGADRV